MSSLSQWGQLSGRVAGKWQLPLLGVSLVSLPVAMYLLRPNPKSMDLGKVAEVMEAYVSAGTYDEALAIGRIAIAREDCVGSVGAPVHLQMARALFGSALGSKRYTANASRTIAEHYREASAGAAAFEPADYVRLARALEWGGQYQLALEWFDEALAKGYPDRPSLLQHIYVTQRDKMKAARSELAPLLDDLFASVPADRLDLIAWAIEERLAALTGEGAFEKAKALLAGYAEQFRGSDFQDLFEYFQTWVQYESGDLAGAELSLRALRNRLDAEDPVSARAGWLLGRTILADEEGSRVEEALSFFRDVTTQHPKGPYATASRLGAAEALASLGKHPQAAELYRFAIDDLGKGDVAGVVDRDEIRTSLSVMAERQRLSGELRDAVAYAELAQSLIDWNDPEMAVAHLELLGRLQSDLAEQIALSPGDDAAVEAREMFARAAATYQRLAGVEIHDEERAADAAWRAAELSARAGDRSEAIALYRIFAESRPAHPLVPRALLRIGQLQQSAGRLAEAIDAYQECYRRFPKLLDGIRSLVPLAQCYVARGPEDLELAEKTLRIIIQESEVFTPDAPEFADALFLLGDVIERRGRYEDAVATLQEAIDRYSKDPRVWRARFLLADSYRQSASALKQDALTADDPNNADRMRSQADDRFARARETYRELIDEYELRRSSDLNDLERVYLRHAYLYEADCYFEARMYRDAVERYDRAAALLRGTPSALAAYVQIINCHVFLGETEEARAALARAEVLADRMKPEAFAESVSPESMSDWKDYFRWLERTNLF